MNYKEINRRQWNERTKVHYNSEFYDNQTFIEGRNSLNPIELNLLGDLKQKRILHLQCHFGQDTLSMARMGAFVTGVDLSDVAINKAIDLAKQINVQAEFICSDVLELPNKHKAKYDIVFTSYGTIGWLPDINKWASVISHFLVPGGKLVFAEFHPVVWMFSYDFTKVEYAYFNDGPIYEIQEGTYTDGNQNVKNESVSWNHTLSDVFKALKNNGLRIDFFEEYNYSPYSCFKNSIQTEPGKFMILGLEGKLPMVYAITAYKT